MVAVSRNIGKGKRPNVAAAVQAVNSHIDDDDLELVEPVKQPKTQSGEAIMASQTQQPSVVSKNAQAWVKGAQASLSEIVSSWEEEAGNADKNYYRDLIKDELAPGMVFKKLSTSPLFGFEFTFESNRYRVVFNKGKAILRLADTIEPVAAEPVKPRTPKPAAAEVKEVADAEEHPIITLLGGTVKPKHIAIKAIPVAFRMRGKSVCFEVAHEAAIKRILRAEGALKDLTFAPHPTDAGRFMISVKVADTKPEVKPAVEDKEEKAPKVQSAFTEKSFHALEARVDFLEKTLAAMAIANGRRIGKNKETATAEDKPAATTTRPAATGAATGTPRAVSYEPVITDRKLMAPAVRAEMMLEALGTKMKGNKLKLHNGTVIDVKISITEGKPGLVELLIPRAYYRIARAALKQLPFANKGGKRDEFQYFLV